MIVQYVCAILIFLASLGAIYIGIALFIKKDAFGIVPLFFGIVGFLAFIAAINCHPFPTE